MKIKNKEQIIAIVITAAVVLAALIGNVYVSRGITEARGQFNQYEKLLSAYQDLGKNGARDIIRNMVENEEYGSNEALLQNVEARLASFSSSFPQAVTKAIAGQREKENDLRRARFQINMAILASIMAGAAAVFLLGIKK
jgi:O-antigen/teichoic acid export membrane protein